MPPAPSAQKLMAENKIDAGDVSGSGKRGQVLKGDVLDAIGKGSAPAAAPGSGASRRLRRKTHRARSACA
jgi:2-oxoglutarate dehydrogenase E2 component (dihydrolipoamide succinyltransferase)